MVGGLKSDTVHRACQQEPVSYVVIAWNLEVLSVNKRKSTSTDVEVHDCLVNLVVAEESCRAEHHIDQLF